MKAVSEVVGVTDVKNLKLNGKENVNEEWGVHKSSGRSGMLTIPTRQSERKIKGRNVGMSAC